MKKYLSKLFRWDKGRQNTGYHKMFLGGTLWPILIDVYLLKFCEGSEIPHHTDKVKSGKHYRLNLVLMNAKEGGEFICNSPLYESKRIKYFRSDISHHSVTKILQGKRYVLSIGWIRGI